MMKRTRNYPRTDFFWTRGHKGPIVTSGSGPFKPEYMQLAIRRENFPFSSLCHEIFSHSSERTWDGTVYVGAMPARRREAISLAKKIRNLGGLARITQAWKDPKGNPQWMIWFNPNGSMPAFDYVSGW